MLGLSFKELLGKIVGKDVLGKGKSMAQKGNKNQASSEW